MKRPDVNASIQAVDPSRSGPTGTAESQGAPGPPAPVDAEEWRTFPPLRAVVAVAERNGLQYDDPDRILDVVVDGVRCVLTVHRTTHGDRLSPREREIARLVAQGCTNRMIATLLDISLWTVSTHMRRMFAKLDVSTRAAMVAAMDADVRTRPGF